MFNFIRQRIELKLGAVFLGVVFIPITVMSFMSFNLILKGIQREIQQRIVSDLNVAVAIYDKIKHQLRYTIRDQSSRVKYYFDTETLEDLPAFLKAVAEQNNLDVLLVTDRRGIVIARGNLPALKGDNLAGQAYLKRALAGEDLVSTELVTTEEMKTEGIKSADPKALMIRVVMPVKEPAGTVRAVMIAGYLLNNNNKIVDLITDLIGAQAAVFQEDTIISSSLRTKDGVRIRGGKTNQKIVAAVLRNGKQYIGEDEIFGTGYINGYIPLRNANDQVVGSLYLRASEEGFMEIKQKVISAISYMAGFSILLALTIGFLVGRPLTKSIESLRRGAMAVANSDFDHKIKVDTDDELKQLADSFNAMTEELKEAQKKLLQSEKMAALGQIAAAVSHELKNPLTGIKMAAYFLRNKVSREDSEANKSLSAIESEADRANKIVMEILTFSQPISPIFNSIQVNEVLAEILPLQEYQAERHDIKVTKRLQENIGAVKADRDQLKQIFDNLINNALQAMGAGGELTVITLAEKNIIKVKIKDTGTGIQEENLKSIFQPFFTTKDKGIGLGLSIVNEIVKKHQGTISVESRLGLGTTFIVSFPKLVV
ncbi:MAG: cache domain-containing protein [Elusimicrobia bacterium]|nr:cache domain-containing protein [Elusimicrobiota bacterium]